MKRFGIILAIVGLILLIGGNLLYRKDSNPIDSAGTSQVTKPAGTNSWAPKIPAFMGGVCIVLGLIFYTAARQRADRQAHSA